MNCILHTGKKLKGVLYDEDFRTNTSRRIYVENHGAIPRGHIIVRSCENSDCINPAHLVSAPRKMHNYGEIQWDDRKGDSNNNATLEEADVIDIRFQRHSGRTYQSIADEYGVSKTCIWSICKGKTWAHI